MTQNKTEWIAEKIEKYDNKFTDLANGKWGLYLMALINGALIQDIFIIIMDYFGFFYWDSITFMILMIITVMASYITIRKFQDSKLINTNSTNQQEVTIHE